MPGPITTALLNVVKDALNSPSSTPRITFSRQIGFERYLSPFWLRPLSTYQILWRISMPPLDPSHCGFSNFLLELTFTGISKFCIVFCLLFSKKTWNLRSQFHPWFDLSYFSWYSFRPWSPDWVPAVWSGEGAPLYSISFSCHLLAPHSPWLSTLAFDNTALIGPSQLPRTVSSRSRHSSLLYLLQMS